MLTLEAACGRATPAQSPGGSGTVSVHEITMAAPDIIVVEVRDPPIAKGGLFGPFAPDTGPGTIPVVAISDNGSGAIRVRVANTTGMHGQVFGIHGANASVNANRGTFTASVVDLSHVDLLHSVFDGSASGGTLVPRGFVRRVHPLTGQPAYCHVVGPSFEYLRFADTQPTRYLDRAAALNASSYGQIGNTSVTAVYPKSVPYDQGIAYSGGQVNCVSMKHFLHLKLSENLARGGPYSIVFPPEAGLPTAAFSFDDKLTRAMTIRATQVGHRAGDTTKHAFLSLWLPGYGVEGRVDFTAYGLRTFQIIDEKGDKAFEGPIKLQIGPTDLETGQAALLTYASTTVPPKVLSDITRSNPGVVTCPNHGFSSGQVKWFRGIGGMTELEFTTAKITVLDADRFSIGGDTSKFKRYSPGTYLPGYDSLVYDTFQANRAATYIFILDYSAWRAAASGTYRVRIPGLGVSDRFRIDEDVWLAVARNACGGFYNQLNGPLDGRFGYTHPVSFRDGTNGVAIYKSLLPASFSSELQAASPTINSSLGAHPPFITTNRATGFFGGYHDAGDWDAYPFAHAISLYNLLDLCYEKLAAIHPAAAATNFGFPRSTETLDPATYAGTDVLPDAIHQVCYWMDGFRLQQESDGRVPSGIAYSETGGGGSNYEPSWISRQQAFLLAADTPNNFAYAGVAAKLAVQFHAAGFSALGDLWKASAIAAFDWAEAVYRNTAGERDAYFDGMLNLKANARWDDRAYSDAMRSLQVAAEQPRLFAAGCLFRLTSPASVSTSYATIVEKQFGGDLLGIWFGCAAWEYCHAAKANITHKAYYTNGPQGWPAVVARVYGASTGGSCYKSLNRQGSPYISSPTLAASVADCGRAFISSRMHGRADQKHLDLLRSAMIFTHGANQSGICLTTGLGHRNTRCLLHRDVEALGIEPPPGFTTYTYWHNNQGGIVVFNFSTDSPLNFTVEIPTGAFESSFGSKRIVSPYRGSFPAMEAFFENSYMIYQEEFTTHQNITPIQCAAMWLHAHDAARR